MKEARKGFIWFSQVVYKLSITQLEGRRYKKTRYDFLTILYGHVNWRVTARDSE